MSFFYNIFISLMIFGMKIFSLFNDKAKKGIQGRKESLRKVQTGFSKRDKVIWMHAASLGEYEQGLPVLEQLKYKLPDHKILITFFSPSGYENVVKKKNIADVVCYLPFDRKTLVKEFVSQMNVALFFTVKYEYWYNLLEELKQKGVKTYVISALFYDTQSFFTSHGKWFVRQLQKNIDWFFHQTEMSYALAKNVGLTKSSVTGDTRFDRVKQLQNQDNHVEFIKDFIGLDKAVVFGSSWQAEEKIAEEVLQGSPYAKLIIAPHDLKRVQHLRQIFPDAVLYSTIHEMAGNFKSRVLIIDSIGLLSKLYSYADIAVVGGGFHSAGLHNILEAATFGVPVIFGNHYLKNPEADELISADGGRSFENAGLAADFVMFLINNEEMMQVMSENAKRFIAEKPESTTLIVKKILS
ncbi:3-deoxy-D-manno-octulosonic acid transferase [Chryseobacterium shandongense]|uniref:3-deoxy-D-manno-octulosonic acid transferase n=1 Tax=Chryseobacterium shandongense TaxID=1493872 RepID=A0AAD1DMR6_9FLAO|nr:glycosyltransferase N-terminal domain-containing protein [Chryseobacterium shandongense]AZA87996.1 3-deoxy-D-manno-octulosonic acid transferase [Chryseobacterium shandongense]AZA96556.1 3-deoxy-D-manno-octulosonic acid transferase [Chryseobacterium shandongense]